MSVILYAEASNGLLTAVSQGWRVGALELQMNAAEAAVGSSQIVIDDPDGTFYMSGLKPLYVVETEATGDAYLGIIGVFWSWNRVVRRGPYRTGPGREVVINVNDLNTLLSYRVQKGGDAEREAETDVERMTWLIGTAEVIGGHGDDGFTIEDTTYFDTGSPVNMDATDYTGQDSAGVANDAMQDSGKNFYLFNQATSVTSPIRVAMWYGHTSNTNFTSLHKISNDLDDVTPATIDHFATTAISHASNYVFAPSIDAELDRDPSRQITSGAMVQYDGGYEYTSRPVPVDTRARRDMVFAGELVKTSGQALQRAAHYVDMLSEEDDAITCAVIVPGKLVNGFHQGHRVGVKFTHMSPEGYAADYVNMRVASRTVRQIPEGAGISNAYEIAMDLRAESPPGPPVPEPGSPVACINLEPGIEAQSFPPLGNGTGGNAADRPSPYVLQYHRAGLLEIKEPQAVGTLPDDYNSWQFPVFGAGGAGTADYAGANIGNSIRIVTISAGTLSIDGFFSHGTSGSWKLVYYVGSTEFIEQSGSIGVDGSPPSVTVPLDDHCNHVWILYNWSSAGPGRFTFQGASWVPETN
jgi:hypothetical protein